MGNKEAQMTDQTVDMPHVDTDERSMKKSLLRGWRRKCPNCGAGPMLKSYLKVNDTCTVCGQELFHHRADDGPAYLTILLVGHLLAPGLHIPLAKKEEKKKKKKPEKKPGGDKKKKKKKKKKK